MAFPRKGQEKSGKRRRQMRQTGGFSFFWRRPTDVYDFILFLHLILFYLRFHEEAESARDFQLSLLANLREETQEDQLDYLDNKVLVDERVREQVQRILDIASHGRNVTCRKVLRAHIRRHNLDDDSRALSPDGDDLVIGRWHARRAERVIWEDGTPNGLQGRRQQGGVQHASVEGVREQSVQMIGSLSAKGFLVQSYKNECVEFMRRVT